MKKCISILLVFNVIAIMLCGCLADKKEQATTVTSTTTTTTTTIPSQHNVTVDEFYQEFSEKFSHTTVTKTNHYDQNYVLLEWEVDYGRSLVFKYNTMLFVDENDNIKKCETHIIRDKFHNQYSDLLSSQQQYDVIVEITFPMYLLSCYHKGIDFNNDQYSTAINDISLYNSFWNKTEYKGSLNGCSFYVKTEDFGVTSYLDYGDNDESAEQTNLNINSILENNDEVFIVCNTMSTTSGTKTVEVYGLFLNDANNIQTKNYTLKYNNDKFIADSSLVADGISFELIEEEGIVKLASVSQTDNYTMVDTAYLDLICDENNRIIGFKVEGGEQFNELASEKMINDCLSLE